MQRGGASASSAAAAPTGCFKCGRPGHWSRDCPSSPATNSSTNPNPNPNPNPRPSTFSSSKFPQPNPSGKATAAASGTTAKKAPKTRPKITPDLLLSEDGLGYVLRHFPRNFKYHGPGHEVADLGNLIGMYSQWHSRLIPYYSFDQFVQKVEHVTATKRVRRCIQELRERVARGGDPTKLHEPPVEQVTQECEGAEEDAAMADPVADKEDPPLESHDAADIHEEMFDEIYEKATEEPSQAPSNMASPEVETDRRPLEGSSQAADNSIGSSQAADNNMGSSSKIQLTDEQKARMEANRLKALERAAARARSTPAP